MSRDEYLDYQWTEMVTDLGQDQHSADPDFQEICQRYSEPHRYYHTLDHLWKMFQFYEEYAIKIKFPASFRLAIWYHDIIYQPTRNDNEKLSAEFAMEVFRKWGISTKTADQVHRLILATAGHNCQEETPDCQLFLDIDLSVLGGTPEEYRNYAEGVRKEFSVFPDQIYQPARKNILAGFLERERLFLTVDFFQRFETRARENISREIAG